MKTSAVLTLSLLAISTAMPAAAQSYDGYGQDRDVHVNWHVLDQLGPEQTIPGQVRGHEYYRPHYTIPRHVNPYAPPTPTYVPGPATSFFPPDQPPRSYVNENVIQQQPTARPASIVPVSQPLPPLPGLTQDPIPTPNFAPAEPVEEEPLFQIVEPPTEALAPAIEEETVQDVDTGLGDVEDAPGDDLDVILLEEQETEMPDPVALEDITPAVEEPVIMMPESAEEEQAPDVVEEIEEETAVPVEAPVEIPTPAEEPATQIEEEGSFFDGIKNMFGWQEKDALPVSTPVSEEATTEIDDSDLPASLTESIDSQADEQPAFTVDVPEVVDTPEIPDTPVAPVVEEEASPLDSIFSHIAGEEEKATDGAVEDVVDTPLVSETPESSDVIVEPTAPISVIETPIESPEVSEEIAPTPDEQVEEVVESIVEDVTETVDPIVEEQDVAAVTPDPVATPRPGVSDSLLFAGSQVELDDNSKQVLDVVARRLKNDDTVRAQLYAYAAAEDDSVSQAQARRKSLSRALAVRSYLIDQGVLTTRIDVRALGDKTESGDRDRVDIIFLER